MPARTWCSWSSRRTTAPPSRAATRPSSTRRRAVSSRGLRASAASVAYGSSRANQAPVPTSTPTRPAVPSTRSACAARASSSPAATATSASDMPGSHAMTSPTASASATAVSSASAPEHPALAREPARQVRRQGEHEPGPGQDELPGAGGRGAVDRRAVQAQRAGVPQQRLQRLQPLGPGDADRVGPRPGRQGERPPGRGRPQHRPRGGARQRAQEAPRLDRPDLGAQAHAGQRDRRLGEAPQPPLRQRHLPLHDALVRAW